MPNLAAPDSASRPIICGSGSYRLDRKEDSLAQPICQRDGRTQFRRGLFDGTLSGTAATAQWHSPSKLFYGEWKIISFADGLSNAGAMTISAGLASLHAGGGQFYGMFINAAPTRIILLNAVQ
ncbi:hypothetical protein [Rhizobium bangladeshense]|uniref:hypothetical protein n=1 Tax=Rhizobium bangladeshense TaxID=1138189 RepID=UPI00110581EE|nr:hypothetical protein [Rhizobium bangladeshense]MBX4895406.1 hypothetical protein [Rhizobium bangladeshense]MBY3614966.1 hypothetical protein [Rhizobium bangladeshense]TLX12297.1 hypothetical protein FFR93_17260 [Rhizobium sp. MHM7A]